MFILYELPQHYLYIEKRLRSTKL